MPVKCQVIMDAMEQLAPRYLAEQWDNIGLLVGSPAQEIGKVLVCLDVTEQVVAQAAAAQVDLIVSHHPLIFKPLKNLRTDLPQGNLIADILRKDMAVFAAHTNLDTVQGGVNDRLIELLSLKEVTSLAEGYQEELVKLTVFVPITHATIVQEALGRAGAGHIGNYSHCSFQTQGKGSFLPLTGSNPFIGCAGEMETVDEVRIEAIMPERLTRRVVKAMLSVHPYEEVAYDVYVLKNKGKKTGLGRIGKLAESVTIEDFSATVKDVLGCSGVRMVKSGDRKVKKVALCSGSGADFIVKAYYQGADVLVTGDVKYHDAQKAQEYSIHVIDAGHFATEIPIVFHLASQLEALAKKEKWNVTVLADNESRDVFTLV